MFDPNFNAYSIFFPPEEFSNQPEKKPELPNQVANNFGKLGELPVEVLQHMTRFLNEPHIPRRAVYDQSYGFPPLSRDLINLGLTSKKSYDLLSTNKLNRLSESHRHTLLGFTTVLGYKLPFNKIKSVTVLIDDIFIVLLDTDPSNFYICDCRAKPQVEAPERFSHHVQPIDSIVRLSNNFFATMSYAENKTNIWRCVIKNYSSGADLIYLFSIPTTLMSGIEISSNCLAFSLVNKTFVIYEHDLGGKWKIVTNQIDKFLKEVGTKIADDENYVEGSSIRKTAYQCTMLRKMSANRFARSFSLVNPTAAIEDYKGAIERRELKICNINNSIKTPQENPYFFHDSYRENSPLGGFIEIWERNPMGRWTCIQRLKSLENIKGLTALSSQSLVFYYTKSVTLSEILWPKGQLAILSCDSLGRWHYSFTPNLPSFQEAEILQLSARYWLIYSGHPKDTSNILIYDRYTNNYISSLHDSDPSTHHAYFLRTGGQYLTSLKTDQNGDIDAHRLVPRFGPPEEKPLGWFNRVKNTFGY